MWKIPTLFQKCCSPGLFISVVGTKWYAILDHTSLISIPYPRLSCSKTLPFTAAHTYIPYIWEYPLSRRKKVNLSPVDQTVSRRQAKGGTWKELWVVPWRHPPYGTEKKYWNLLSKRTFFITQEKAWFFAGKMADKWVKTAWDLQLIFTCKLPQTRSSQDGDDCPWKAPLGRCQ